MCVGGGGGGGGAGEVFLTMNQSIFKIKKIYIFFGGEVGGVVGRGEAGARVSELFLQRHQI